MTIGEKLRFFRTAEGYSQRTVAHILNMNRSTYAYYETGKTLPALRSVWILAKLYGVTMEFLVDDRQEPSGGGEFLLLEAKKRSRRKRNGI